jgi:hypothetical protein
MRKGLVSLICFLFISITSIFGQAAPTSNSGRARILSRVLPEAYHGRVGEDESATISGGRVHGRESSRRRRRIFVYLLSKA